MSEIKVNDRALVVPGETLATGLDYLPGEGCYRNKDEIKACMLGLANVKGRLVKLIPLGGRYIPKEGDLVIGVVSDVRFSNWNVNINSPYEATLQLADASEQYLDTRKNDMSDFFDIGDTVIAMISNVDDHMNTNVSLKGPGLRKARDGNLLDVASAKVPRIIGKGGSMITMIKDATGCQITVGQNGRIWFRGLNKEAEEKAIRAIKFIEEQAHTTGLTEKVRDMLGLPPGEENGQTTDSDNEQ